MPVVSLLAAIVVALCTTFGAATVRAEAPTDQPPLSQPAIDAGTSTAQGAAPAAMTDQLIVGTDGEMSRSFVAAAANAAGADVSGVRVSSGDAATFVVALGSEATAADLAAVVADLEAQPGVAWAEPDRRMFPTIVPNDAYFGGYQWDLAAPTAGRYGIDAPVAWDITTGAADVRTAVVDTGYLDHADLAGRFIGGYDFVSDEPTANDGDARDADAHDPGDWITSEEAAAGYFEGCDAGPSSWHGTHVAGTIGANGNNSLGVAGINWASKIVPVRALGKCGGYTSDIVDAMRWSAGLTVSGVPTNPYPVDVVNLSLGGSGPCGTAMGTAISEITAIGASVVVAAGNSNSSVSWASPANCPGVITVAATGKSGNRASYSNYGSLVTLAAPGGDGAGSIVSTLNAGMTTPGLDDYAGYQGTSMAAPHVAGVVSLMLAAHPTLTPAQVKAVLRSTVTPFPGGSTCTTSLCGSGILHASTAVAATAVAAVPAAPRQPVATWDGTSVVLTWLTVTRTGGSPITDYIVQVSSNSAASWSTVPDGVSTAATATVTGPTPSAPVRWARRSRRHLLHHPGRRS